MTFLTFLTCGVGGFVTHIVDLHGCVVGLPAGCYGNVDVKSNFDS